MAAKATDDLLRHEHMAEVVVQAHLPGEPQCSVHLKDEFGRVDAALDHEFRSLPHTFSGQARSNDCRVGLFYGDQSIGQMVLDRLERADRPAELLSLLREGDT